MIPALNQYPRPNLALARKRIKQRDERQNVTERQQLETVSAEIATATDHHNDGETWGRHKTRPPTTPAPTGLRYRPSLRSGWSHNDTPHDHTCSPQQTPRKQE